MAARVGTIYVELDLDDSKFDKRQTAILNKSKAASADIEKNFKTLGVKSDIIYQAMANGAIKAYDMIALYSRTSTDEQFRAQSAMVAKINALNVQMAQNPLYNTLGIKSVAMINAQKAAVISSYNTIKKSGQATAQDLVNIERAKNIKLKELNKEMVGQHDMSMAAMTRAVLRFYAAYYVISQVGRVVTDTFMSGVKAIDDLKVSAVSVAAQITSMQGTTGDVLQNYKDNLKYAEALVPVLMRIDASSFANLQQIQRMNMAMTNQGVILDTNNAKQLESFTALSNAIALFTIGQNKEKQATQEMRALMSGDLLPGALVAKSMDALIKQEGIYKGGLKEIVKLGREHNDTLERMHPYLVGIVAAAGDIQATWESVSSSLETSWVIIQKEVFKDFYKGLVEGGIEAAAYVKEHTKQIGDAVRDMALGVKMSLELAGGAFISLKLIGVTTALALKTAFSSAFIFLEGWTIGTWLNSFKEVRMVAIDAIGDIMQAFIWLKYGVEVSFAAIESAWDTVVVGMKKAFYEFLFDVAKGIDYLPWGGTAADSIRAYAAGIDEAIKATKTFAEKDAELVKEREKALALNRMTIDGLEKEAEVMGDIVKTPIVPMGGSTNDEAQKAADRIAKTIADLEWQLSIIEKTTEEQAALNAVRSAGTTINTEAGQVIYNLTMLMSNYNKAQSEAKKLIEDSRTPFENFLLTVKKLDDLFKSGNIDARVYGIQFSKALDELNDANKSTTIKVFDAWTEAAKNIHNVWTDMLTGLFNGEGLDFSSLTKNLGNALNTTVTNSMTAAFSAEQATGTGIIGSAMAGISAINPAMLGAGIGLSLLGGLLEGGGEPSFGSQLEDALDSLKDQIEKNTLATELNTKELLEGVQYGSQDILNRAMDSFSDKIIKNRTLFQTFGLPDLMDANLTGPAYTGKGAKPESWAHANANPDELTAMFDVLMAGLKDDVSTLYNVFYNLSKGNITPFMWAMKDLGASVALTQEQTDTLTKSFKDSWGERNVNVGEAVVDIFKDIFATIENEAVVLRDSVESIFKSWSSTIEEFNPTTTYQQTYDDFNEFKETEIDQIKKLLALDAELGDIFNLPPEVKADYEKQIAMVNELGTAIYDHFKNLRAEITSDMATELAIADGSMSQHEQNVLNINKASDDYYDSLVDAGNTADNARIKTDAWADSMTAAMKTTMLTADRNSYNLKILQALGKDEKYLALQREIELDAINAMYGATSDMAVEIKGLAETLWDVEDAAKASADALSFHKTKVGFWINVREQMEAAFKPEYMLDFLSEPGFSLKGLGLDALLQPQDTAEFANLMDVITALGDAGLITATQWKSLADFGFSSFTAALDASTQAIEDEAASRAAAKDINQRSIDWRNSFKPISDLAQDFKDIEDDMATFRKEILATGHTVSAYWLPGGAVEKETKQAVLDAWQKDMLSTISDLRFSLAGSDSVAELIDNQLIPLMTEYNNIAADNYTDQIQSLSDQSNILTQIRDIQTQQLEETINNYRAIQDTIYSLQGGDLAAVQSVEFFERRYAQLLEEAQSGGSTEISALNSFISQYADFMDDYGGDYTTLTSQMISDLTGLQDGITGGATLDDLESRLADLNEGILAGVPTDMATIIANLDRIYAEVNGAYLNSSVDVVFPHFAGGGSYSGGLALVGERGPELINSTPGTVHSNSDTAKIIADAVSSAIVKTIGSGESGGDVYLQVDGEVFAKIIGRQLRSGQPDLTKPLIKMTRAA